MILWHIKRAGGSPASTQSRPPIGRYAPSGAAFSARFRKGRATFAGCVGLGREQPTGVGAKFGRSVACGAWIRVLATRRRGFVLSCVTASSLGLNGLEATAGPQLRVFGEGHAALFSIAEFSSSRLLPHSRA